MTATVSPIKPLGTLDMDALMAGGFVMAPTWLFRMALVLPGAQLKVLLFLVLRLIHRRKAHDYIALEQIQSGCGKNEVGTGLSRSAVKGAINALEKDGFITVRHQSWGPSVFGLGVRFSTLGQPPTQAEIRPGEPETDPEKGPKTNPTIETPSINTCRSSTSKPDTKTRHDDAPCTSALPPVDTSMASVPEENPPSLSPPDVHHRPLTDSPSASFAPTAPTQHAPAGPAFQPTESQIERLAPPCPPAARNSIQTGPSLASSSELSGSGNDKTVVSSSEDLFYRLTHLHRTPFAARTAAWIIATYPHEAIETELANLPHRKADNPAGFLLAALKTGDYAPPKRAVRPPIFRAPATFSSSPPNSVLTISPASAAQDAPLRAEDTVPPELPSELKAEFMLQARRRFAQVLTLPLDRVSEDHPLVRAYFTDLVLTHLQKTQEQQAA